MWRLRSRGGPGSCPAVNELRDARGHAPHVPPTWLGVRFGWRAARCAAVSSSAALSAAGEGDVDAAQDLIDTDAAVVIHVAARASTHVGVAHGEHHQSDEIVDADERIAIAIAGA